MSRQLQLEFPRRSVPLDYDEVEQLIEDIDHQLARRIDVAKIHDPERRRFILALRRGPVEYVSLDDWVTRHAMAR